MSPTKRRRHTPQRQVILDELHALHTHPTAAELYALVRQRLPRISLGTVYRNLEVLCEDGLARQLPLAGADTRYDGQVHRHDHVRCTACGIVRDLPAGTVPTRPGAAGRGGGLRHRGLSPGVPGALPGLPRGRRRPGTLISEPNRARPAGRAPLPGCPSQCGPSRRTVNDKQKETLPWRTWTSTSSPCRWSRSRPPTSPPPP